MSRKRILLLGVAGLLSASALLAIGILLVGQLGETEGRILGTTALLAGYGLVALPAVVLLDQGRLRPLAVLTASCAAVAAAIALTSVWTPDAGDALGRSVGTATLVALALAQVSALAARRRDRDPPVVRPLFAASCATAGLVAAAGTALLWAQPHSGLYPRLYGALVILDVLLVALQPILARARPAAPSHRLVISTDDGLRAAVTVDAPDLAAAAAKAIRTAEHEGRNVVAIEVTNGGAARTRTSRRAAEPPSARRSRT